MTKLISNIIALFCFLLFISCNTIKNVRTEQVHIYGNCGMCKETIENAGNKKNEAKVSWNKDTKMADLSYDTIKTNQNEILKRIAKAGYDSENFLAPKDIYDNLPECCHYDRNPKAIAKNTTINETGIITKTDTTTNVSNTIVEKIDTSAVKATAISYPLKEVFETYFSLKDALVKSDGKTASLKAKELLALLNNVDMKMLNNNEHTVWMKVNNDLKFDAGHIEETKDVSHQRGHFSSLSTNMYKLIKVSKNETTVYYQHCPMYDDGKGANWLSKEKAIKNPYYGSQMLNCGSVQETIK
ncbi:MAG: DUF3347 domain-containing protein [Chitinophagaceae bacterium]|nr:DUF3347 domain-containing protein [Chitinophagaceae bacterium]